MSIVWNDIFQLPVSALADGRRITKTMLVQQAALTKHEQKTLDKVKKLEHFATVSKSTTKMLPVINDERDIQSIIFLCCEMSSATQAVAEVARLIHKCFPNPVVIMWEANEKISISVSLTRKSLAEQGAVVIERLEALRAFDPEAATWKDYLGDIAYPHMPQSDLLTYLMALSDRTAKADAISAIGMYPRCKDAETPYLMLLLGQLRDTQAEINALRLQYRDKEATLAESSRLRMAIKKKERELDGVITEIKELCNG